ncbi:hypothetical protein NXF25_003580 [Crotalus adamanteus]|uniref:Ribonuclease A-domain domain-containing protein n=1 Tax=Crotalus adamanteus TaxID=8729 RepID=A0AAW1CDG3_CROAD
MASNGVSMMILFFISISVINISRSQSPQAFQRKHMTFLDNIDHNRCNREMQNRRIALTRNGCKRLNTFIHAPEKLIDHICVTGKPYVIQNLEYKKSTMKFHVTSCRLSQEYGKDCKYKAEDSRWKYIVVSCNQNDRPVHLAGILTW